MTRPVTYPLIRRVLADAARTSVADAARLHHVNVNTVYRWRMQLSGPVRGDMRQRVVAHVAKHGPMTAREIFDTLGAHDFHVMRSRLYQCAERGLLVRVPLERRRPGMGVCMYRYAVPSPQEQAA